MNAIESAIEEQIQDLLSLGRTGTRQYEQTAFDKFARSRVGSLVLFGAGGLGRRTLKGLRSVGVEPLAFADNNPALWGQSVGGLQVYSPAEAADRFGQSATFVVTIWGVAARDRMRDRVSQFRSLGCETIVPFPSLFWKYADRFLPYQMIDRPSQAQGEADTILAACDLWADDFSRREYLAQLRWRLRGDFDRMADPVPENIYFPGDLLALGESEVFVDCGAYDGDTVASFLALSRGRCERIVAFEPDPVNLVKLRQSVGRLAANIGGRIEVHQKAVGASDCQVRFAALGTDGSVIAAEGLEVTCVALDSVLTGQPAPTFIKMDIEGAELDALAGARKTLARFAPVLAICSYHRQTDLWQIPMRIHSINPDYRLFLRPHLADGWDSVCYAIPPGRSLPAKSMRTI